jgi:putative transposase
VAKSRQVHAQSRAGGEKLTCGPAQLDKLLTEARRVTPWLAQGAYVPQQQVIRDFVKSRAKALCGSGAPWSLVLATTGTPPSPPSTQ